jgi:uncharacterized membrane protein YfhO
MKKQSEARRRVSFLLLYTILFPVICILVFRYFPEEGKRMVWKGDGISQHYTALCYYARWGKAVLKSLLEGHPSFPTFNMHIGFGADLFTTLQYYVIGDPFSLPAVFVPEKHMLLFHDAMIPLRMYLAGICFDGFCREMGHRDTAANLCGSLMYVFCSFALFGMRHPYFLNAMIWFPLLLIGAERIFRGRPGRLFTAAVFLSCISNFYFFYMLVLLTVVYVVWRALRICLFPVFSGKVTAKEAFGRILLFAGKFLWRAVLGTAIGAVFMLPILLRFSQDPRASEGVAYGMFYPAEYYRGLLESFVGFGTATALMNWTCLGMGGIGLLGVLLLFAGGEKADEKDGKPENNQVGSSPERKGLLGGHVDLKIAFICMTLMTLLPAAGAALNGFSYPANRWIWAFCMLTAYIAVVTLPSLKSLSPVRMTAILVIMCAYAGVCKYLGSGRSVLCEIIFAAAAAALVWAVRRILQSRGGEAGEARRVSVGVSAGCGALLIAAVAVSSLVHAHVCFKKSVRYSGTVEYHSDQYIDAMIASDAAGMRALLGNDSFYRYSARDIANNFSLFHDVSNTQYYWSLSDSRIEQFFTETGQHNGLVDLFDNLDNRTMLDEIAGVSYYKRGDGSLLPFGYEKMDELHYDNRELFEEKEDDPLPIFSFSVYKNQYALPLGFTTDRYLTRETYEALSIPRRQEALMQGLLLEDEGVEHVTGQSGDSQDKDTGIREAELSFTDREVPFTFQADNGIAVMQEQDGSVSVSVSDTDARLYLKPEEEELLSEGEISLLLTGMDYALPEDGMSAEEMQAFTNTDPVEVRVVAKLDGETVSDKIVEYGLADNPWKTGRSDFLCCCGYTDTPLSDMYMKFARRGTYVFKGLKVICQPMAEYPAQAAKLREYCLEDLNLNELAGSGATDRITGTLTVPEKRLLCMQIPRCDGLTAYVDGNQVPLLQADTLFCAVEVEAGTHEVELVYRTPGLEAGAFISAAALLIVILETVIRLFHKKQ